MYNLSSISNPVRNRPGLRGIWGVSLSGSSRITYPGLSNPNASYQLDLGVFLGVLSSSQSKYPHATPRGRWPLPVAAQGVTTPANSRKGGWPQRYVDRGTCASRRHKACRRSGLCCPLSQNTSCILEQQKQLPLTHWRRYETEAPVKCICVGIDRVRQHRANAGLLGDQ